ncbi:MULTISPECIES: MurR/RpiR family transcriptional regulator [Pseudoalteromonas]|uniref:Transcriptional regulator n=1 Tax=Pseudoalteromonas amylolytica TaxID=1859457 RepID=A0A1S1MVR5_9GAMM|nr:MULTISPECIES: MurR/RpiR family transcriptional regulator [Pseudoalteromonas]OHU87661.1 transcriptional regulator [Pseudoalteromonas sp. JW3]OHU91103.1 transcriptional regulator [Pseudoalteromonas amylolytica]
MDIIDKISQGMGHFSPAEQKVAKLILSDLHFAASASIDELAQRAQVSNASITRLAKSLQCDNVRDLKLQLAKSTAVGERFLGTSLVERVNISHVYSSIEEILHLNAPLIEEQVVQQACDAICSARHCLIYGVGGGSSMLATECQNRLFRLDILSNAHSDPMLMRMTASTINKSDVVISLSISGVSPDVIDATRIAKEYGAVVIAICPEGELCALADFHLPIKTQESDYIFKPSAARYAMMAAVDILSSEVAMKNQRRSKEKLRRLKMQLDRHRNEACGADPVDKRFPLGD